mgnify:CR=1 FL=1
MKRVYVPQLETTTTASPQGASLSSGTTLSLGGALHAYLTRSLRLTPGDDLHLFDGRGGECHAEITAIDAKKVTLQVGPVTHRKKQGPELILVQGLVKASKMDLIIQKATELGVDRIVPAQCSRSVPQLSGKRREKRSARWEKIAAAACGQCGRAWLPNIPPPTPFRDALSLSSSPQDDDAPNLQVVLWEEERGDSLVALLEATPPLPAQASVALVVGPEGGLTVEEVEQARRRGYTVAGLGPLILRSETAALAALTLAAAKADRLS